MRISRPLWIAGIMCVVLGGIIGLELGRAEGLRIINKPNDLGPSIPRSLTLKQIESRHFTVDCFSFLGAFSGIMLTACSLGLAYVIASLSVLWRRAYRPPDKILQMADTVKESR